MTERIPASASEAAVRRSVATLRSGQCVVLPTDSCYAVCANAFDPSAVDRLRRATRRTRQRPFGVLIRSPRQVTGLVSDIPEAADRLMAAYWPGPLTIVLSAAEGLGWDLGDTLGTVGLRMPTDDLLLRVIADVGPVAAAMAAMAGQPPPRDVDAAESALGAGIALYVDGGRCDGALSTIVDCTHGRADVLREGAVPRAHVEAVSSGRTGWGEQPPLDDAPRDDAPAGDDAAATDDGSAAPAAGGDGRSRQVAS